MNIIIFIAVALLFISLNIFSATTQPHIMIFATGGTIAGTAANTTQTSGYNSGKVGVQTLINAAPEIKNIARFEGQQIANIGSKI